MNVKDEIIDRMKLLHLHPNVINEFKNERKLNMSVSPLGSLYWLTEDEMQMVKNFEQEHQDLVVYHILKTFTRDFGIVYDLLYVSNDEEEWETDRKNIKDDLVMSRTLTEFAESGLIKIKCINGGIIRAF